MESTQEYMQEEKRRALFVQAPISNATVVVISGLYLYILWDHLPQNRLIAWAALMWSAALFRLLLWYLQKQLNSRSTSYWTKTYTLASTWLGCCWSLIYLFLFSLDNLVVTVALLMLLFGVVSSAVVILSVHLPAFIGYSYPQILVFLVTLLYQQNLTYNLMALGLLMYLVMLTLFARNSFRLFRDWVELSARNRELVANLNTEMDQREKIIEARTFELREENKARKNTELELIEQKESFIHLAQHDPLTELPNRMLMMDRLNQSIRKAQRQNTQIAVLFLDLDHFKDINDSLGHSIGDQLLRAVARRLVRMVRQEDTVARIGGDEFTLLIDRITDSIIVSRLAQEIIDEFKRPLDIDGRSIQITASIGISLYPSDGGDTETLIRNADAAMYLAKDDGRNTMRYYSSELTQRAAERMAIEADLRNALVNDEFYLVLQPQYDLRSNRLVGAEALIRWRHPERGEILPGQFIPVAENSELIDRIGDWVLQRVCYLIKTWNIATHGLRLAANISGHHITMTSLVETIRNLTTESGCDPHGLEIEITEGFLIKDPELTRKMLEQLNQMGIHISIDDFGTGYSSLSYLKVFSIQKIKIDQSFIRDIHVDANDQAITDAIIALGEKLGLTVIAEGVENKQQAEYLRQQGCHQGQGYYFARPMPEAAFAELLEHSLTPPIPGVPE